MIHGWPLTLRGTGAAVLAVASFVIGQRAGIPELLYFGVLLVALLVGALVVLVVRRRSDEVSRRLTPDTAEVGRRATVEVRVSGRTALPTAPGRWIDTLPAGLRGHADGVFPAGGAALIGSGAPVHLRYDVVGHVRGIHEIGPLEVITTDPFGLVRRRFALGRPTPVTVAPRIVDLASLPSTVGEAGGTRQSSTLHPGQGSDNLVARPYAPGDSMRRIHWRATARRDTLMVRQEEQETTPAATVVLDRGVSRWSFDAIEAPGSDHAFETAVSACVSVAARLIRDGYAVDVVDSDGELLCDPIESGSEADIRALAIAFATLRARSDHSSRRIVPASAAAMAGPVVVITGALEAADLDGSGSLAHRSALPVLVSIGHGGDLDGVRAAGWSAVSLAPGGDLSGAWDAALDRRSADVGY